MNRAPIVARFRTPRSVARGIPLFLALLSLAAPALAREPGAGPPYPVELFDVATLVKPVQDFPGPRFELSAGRALASMMREIEQPGTFGARERPPALLTGRELEDLARETDPVWETDPVNIRLKFFNDRLLAQGPQEAIDRLRSLLASLEKEATRAYLVRAVLVQVPEGAGPDRLGAPGSAFSPEGASALLDDLPEKQGAIVAEGTVGALNGQRVHLADGRERAFVVDYDVVLGKETAKTDPVVEIFRDGLVLDVRPISSPTGKRVRLDLFIGYTRFDADTARFETGNPELGSLDLPRVSGFRMETSVVVPEGDFLLIGPLLPVSDRFRTAQTADETLPGKKKKASPTTSDPPEPGKELHLLVQVRETPS